MINIIDVYESDAVAQEGREDHENKKITDAGRAGKDPRAGAGRAHSYGGFLGAWTKTAKLTFPHVYIFGTDATRARACARRSSSSPR